MNQEDWDRAKPATPALLGLTRRSHLESLIPGFLCYALISEARARAIGVSGNLQKWIDLQQDLGTALKRGEIKPVSWATEFEKLAAQIDSTELMSLVALSKTRLADKPTTNDPQKRSVQFVDEDGAPRKLVFATALFEFSPKNVITPHGHKNMVSAHMVVQGKLRIRNFDRIRDEIGAMIVRPTLDYVAQAGDVSTMCSERNNIHWFVPKDGPATTFDVILSNLDQAQPPYEIDAIDIIGGRALADGLIQASKISFEESSEKYTSAV